MIDFYELIDSTPELEDRMTICFSWAVEGGNASVCWSSRLGIGMNSSIVGEVAGVEGRKRTCEAVGVKLGCGWRCGFVSYRVGVADLMACTRVTMGMPMAPAVVN